MSSLNGVVWKPDGEDQKAYHEPEARFFIFVTLFAKILVFQDIKCARGGRVRTDPLAGDFVSALYVVDQVGIRVYVLRSVTTVESASQTAKPNESEHYYSKREVVNAHLVHAAEGAPRHHQL